MKIFDIIIILIKNPKYIFLLLKGLPISISSFNNLQSIKNYQPIFHSIIDAGANIGQFTFMARQIFPYSEIFSFEPANKNYARLTKNTKKLKNINLYNLGLGDEIGEFDFYEYEFDQIDSFKQIDSTNENPNYKNSEPLKSKVNVVTLNSVLGKITLKQPVLLKLDVQGFEEKVLAGASTLLNCIDYILIEIAFEVLYKEQKTFDEMYTLLQESGYEIVAPIGFNYGKNNKIIEIDFLFKKKI